tara:strand:- start:12656 stop:13297 length:642 start_codon:yes stop_codon:yes gene_type:complete
MVIFKSFEEVGRAVESVALTIHTTQKYHLTFRKSFTQFSSVPVSCYQEAIRESNYGLVYDQMTLKEASKFRQAIRQEARRQMDDCGLESTEKTRERLESLVEVHKVAKIQPTVKVFTNKVCLDPFDSKYMWSKFKPQPIEEEKSMKITRPVLVGKTNILVATDEQLTQIIRDCKDLIKDDADMTKISTKFQEKAAELEEVIKLCLVQLDGDKS